MERHVRCNNFHCAAREREPSCGRGIGQSFGIGAAIVLGPSGDIESVGTGTNNVSVAGRRGRSGEAAHYTRVNALEEH